MKIKVNQTVLKQNEIYQIYQCQDQKNQKLFLQLFSRKMLHSYGIDQNIQHNISTFQSLKEAVFPQSILKIYSSSSEEQLHKIVTEAHSQNLLEYMKKHSLKQKQALSIFSQILKAVFSVIMVGVKPVNVRPQHFVKVKNAWKLKSLVMNTDINKAKGITSEYLWDPIYQAPQQYINNGKQLLQDEDLKLVVWNLGSILLDLLTSKHLLKNQQIIKKFQNKEFSFKLVQGDKIKQVSKQTQKIVCQMLHYNPKQRVAIQKIFQNQKLSQEVSQHFLSVVDGKADSTIQELELKMTQKLSQSVKSSLLKTKSNIGKIQQKKEELPKNFTKKLQNIKKDQNQIESILAQKDTQIADDDFIMNSLDLISNKIQKKQEKHVTFNKDITTQIITGQDSYSQMPKQQSFFQNERFRKVFQIYKTYLDRSQLLFVTSHKFSQIPFQTQADQIILLSKYAVYFVGLMNLNNIVLAINHNKNIYKIESSLFGEFIESIQYKSFKMYINTIFEKKETVFERLKLQLEDFNSNKKNLLKTKEIIQFAFDSQFRAKQFNQVKLPYRKILKKSYDSITKKYNAQKSESIGRLGMYVVCCMTVDKLYQENDIQKNFNSFFQWMKKPPSKYVNISLFQKYLDQANVGILIKHARYVLQTYFNV